MGVPAEQIERQICQALKLLQWFPFTAVGVGARLKMKRKNLSHSTSKSQVLSSFFRFFLCPRTIKTYLKNKTKDLFSVIVQSLVSLKLFGYLNSSESIWKNGNQRKMTVLLIPGNSGKLKTNSQVTVTLALLLVALMCLLIILWRKNLSVRFISKRASWDCTRYLI